MKYNYEKAINYYLDNSSKSIKQISEIFCVNRKTLARKLNQLGIDISRVPVKEFINISNKIHNNKYDYSNVNYKHGKSKVVIKCQSGHLFEQSPDLHLRGSGCFICNTGYGYKRDKFISLCKQKKIKPFLYIINCFNNTENFYKIGITTRSVKERYRSKLLMPYSFILTQEISGSPEEIYDLEKLLHKLCKSKLYKPLIKFDGSTECFKFN